MSASTTRAPSAAMSGAVASPRPLAAPVIATTLPATRPLTTPPQIQDPPPTRATTLAVLVTGAQPPRSARLRRVLLRRDLAEPGGAPARRHGQVDPGSVRGRAVPVADPDRHVDDVTRCDRHPVPTGAGDPSLPALAVNDLLAGVRMPVRVTPRDSAGEDGAVAVPPQVGLHPLGDPPPGRRPHPPVGVATGDEVGVP